MRVYAVIDDPRMALRDLPAHARLVESLGYSGLLVPEAVHDVFVTALLALESTCELEVATSVALAFPRSPTTTAHAAWDLQSLSRGRLTLGLGSQVKGNIVGRFGVAWHPPVARMRDYVGALRAVWRCWQEGGPLAYESTHYRLDRMQPFFNPGPIEHPRIPIHLGGVNRGMTELAGEIADGFMTHPTNSSPRFLRERTLPALAAGAARAGRGASDVAIIASVLVATGETRAAVAAERARARQHLTFLYSTPHYWPTLELYGWQEAGRTLHALSRAGKWDEMGEVLTGAMLDHLVPSGTHDEIGAILTDAYAGLVGGITLPLPKERHAHNRYRRLIRRLRDA